jgi:hypothetical protein
MAMRAPSPSEPDIPAEAPTAPTEEAWARMSPAEREQAVEALLASESLEEIEEREAMAEGDPHLDAKMQIRSTLRSHFERLGRRIYVGADIKVYYPGKKGFTPDVIAVTDVDPRMRDCWMVSQEGKGIELAFEVHYDRRRPACRRFAVRARSRTWSWPFRDGRRRAGRKAFAPAHLRLHGGSPAPSTERQTPGRLGRP